MPIPSAAATAAIAATSRRDVTTARGDAATMPVTREMFDEWLVPC